MKQALIVVLGVIFLASCTHFTTESSLAQDPGAGSCIEIKENMGWQEIQQIFGDPDSAPVPSRDLFVNTRGYQGVAINFRTENKEVNTGGSSEFKEIVTGIEVCR
ncbi:MAG: hypothetical protein AB9866_07715 [Syntrophobacteraceae bacterium]